MPDGRRNIHRNAFAQVQPEINGRNNLCISFLRLHSLRLKGVFSHICKVSDLHVLEHRKLNRISADGHPLNLVEVNVEFLHQTIGSID